MNSLKKLLIILLALAVVFCFAACGGSDQQDQAADDQQEEQAEAQDDAQEEATDDQSAAPEGENMLPDTVYVTVNGIDIYPGSNYNDIAGKIGDEVKPSERIEPCDPEFESADNEYYFDGLEITANDDGLIRMINVYEGEGTGAEVLFSGKLALGSAVDEFKAILGEPEADAEDESFLPYYYDNGNMLCYKDEADNTKVNSYIIGFNDIEYGN